MDRDHHVAFDSSLEEIVVFQQEFMRGTREGRSWRRREQFMFSFSMTAVVAVMLVIKGGHDWWWYVFAIGGVGIVAAVLAIPFGWFYDHRVRTRMTRLISEQWGSGPYQCSIEVQPDALKVVQASAEWRFPWQTALAVEERPDGVFLSFKGGRVLARSRGFASPEHQQRFLKLAREMLSPDRDSPSPGTSPTTA